MTDAERREWLRGSLLGQVVDFDRYVPLVSEGDRK